MFFILYPVSLVLCVVALSMWFFFQSKQTLSRVFRVVFFLTLALYVVVVMLQGGSLMEKWPILLRDLGIMAFIPVALSFLRRSAILFFPILIAASVAIGLFSVNFSDQLFGENSLVKQEDEWELLVEIDEEHSLKDLQAITRKYGLIWKPAFQMKNPDMTQLDDYYVVEIPEPQEVNMEEIESALMQSNMIDWIEENELISVAPIPSPPISRKPEDFGVNDPDLEHQWEYFELRVDELYKLFREKKLKARKKALIAILDTGVESKHEDLKGQYRSINSRHDEDVNGHGTHCAGIAAAVTNNGKGIASLAPSTGFIEVTSIKVLSDLGSGKQQSIIQGILNAADAEADVISLSLGGRSNQSRQKAYQKAVTYAKRSGAIVIAAAGNSDDDARFYAPANTPGIIAVSAVDTQLQKASFSNTVQGLDMGIAAPGVNIYSTMVNGTYTAQNGTSMATPFVAGLVGLMKSLRPELTTEEAFTILHKTGTATPQGAATGKLVQPVAAIEYMLSGG